MVDHSHNLHPGSAVHHPHLHGPTDHCCYHQQKGTQAKGIDMFLWSAEMANVFSRVCLSVRASTERLRVPPGPVCGGRDVGRVLFDGAAVVCGGDGSVDHPREQPETGV